MGLCGYYITSIRKMKLAFRDTQNQTTMRHCFTVTEMAVEKKTCWEEYGEIELSYALTGVQNGAATLENRLAVLWYVKRGVTI